MRKASQLPVRFLPGMDALEDRQLLSGFGGPSPYEGGFPIQRDVSVIVIRPFHGPDHSPGPSTNSYYGSPEFRSFDFRGGPPGDGHGGESAPRPLTASRTSPFNPSPPQIDHGPPVVDGSNRAVNLALVTSSSDAFSNRIGPLVPASVRVPAASKPVDDTPAVAARNTSSQDNPLLVASPNVLVTAVAAPAIVNRGDQTSSTALSEAPSVFQAVNLGSTRSPISSPRAGLAQGEPLPPVSQTPEPEESVNPSVQAVEAVSLESLSDPEEIPSPLGADLITDLVPFNLESIKDSFSWVLGQFEDLESPVSDQAGPFRFLIPIVTALGAIEFARRWRNRRSHLGPIRVWKTRSSVLRGFF